MKRCSADSSLRHGLLYNVARRGGESSERNAVTRAITAQSRDRRADERARCTATVASGEDETSMNSRATRHCKRCGLPLASVCPARARPKKVSIMWMKRSPGVASTRTRASRSLAFHQFVRLDGGCLSLAENTHRSAPCDSQLTDKNGEAFDHPGMAVFAHDARSGTRDQFGDRAVLGVLVGKLGNRGALPRHGILPDFSDLDRCSVPRLVWVRMRHRNNLSAHYSSG